MEKLLLFLLIARTLAMDNLKVAFQWKQVDFEYPTEEARQSALASKEFIPENNLPLGLEVHGDRLFITVPRWRSGVAASLTYINLSDSSEAPKLRPYPSWEAHRIRPDQPPEIVSPFRVRADKCGRLWVLDTGLENILSSDTKSLAPTRLLVYSLRNDTLLRSYVIPDHQIKTDSFFANLAVEDHDCGDSFAYLGDLGKPAIIVYSWKTGESWRVQHNFFHIDPLSGEFNVSGIIFEWTDGVFGLALSKPDAEGFSTLYFHPLTSTNEFSVSTKYLRDENLAKSSFHMYKHLGSRGPKGQSGVSFLDQKTDVLFYSLINLNAVACWRTTNPAYTMESQGRIYMSNVTMVFPNDIKVDSNDNLWVLSDRLPKFMYDVLDRNDINFRILTAPVADAIRGTACDSKLVISPKFKPSLGDKERNSVAKIEVKLSLFIFLLVAIRNL
ncbi:yellow-b [Asbolus verrucosus]|uniref:Yellow-b n=1 Tax=Asbolus verrucosus TaxID=1661398 RepID=A0A482VLX1_ASBVE|nr:yellow-b [Asbolus verrucosus]